MIPRRACTTGGGGFIGSRLAETLHDAGSEFVVVDDFRTGRRQFLDGLRGSPRFTLVEGGVLDRRLLTEATHGCDWVFHLQANADVRRALDRLRIIAGHLDVSPHVAYARGERGWVGDSPLIHLDITKIRSLGWAPALTIPEAIQRTLAWFDANESVWRDHIVTSSSS